MSFTAAHEPPSVEARVPGGGGGDMKALDATIAKWKEHKVSAYSDELYMVAAMRAEIEALREKVYFSSSLFFCAWEARCCSALPPIQ